MNTVSCPLIVMASIALYVGASHLAPADDRLLGRKKEREKQGSV